MIQHGVGNRAPTDGLQDFTPSWMYSNSGQVLFSSALKYCVDEDNIVEISGSYQFTHFPAGGSPQSLWPLPVKPTTDGLMFGADMTTGSALVGTVSAQDVTVSFMRIGGGAWGADGETVQVSGRYRS